MSARFDVCILGSANLDLVATTRRLPLPGETVLGHGYAEHAGGKGLNQAVAAARSGASTAFVGALGSDEAGRRLMAVLNAEHIDVGGLAVVPGPTGRALILVDDTGENSIVVVAGANGLVATDAPIPPTAVLLAQLEVPIETVTRAAATARAAGGLVILNPAPAAPLPPALLAACDFLVPNQHELEHIGGVDAALAAGCRAVVVTRGADGVDVHTTAGVSHTTAFQVPVVDTTGAGDAFCGALAARLAAGDPLDDAVRWASAAGALATTVPGAVPAQPTAAAIERLLRS
ncbi:MAG TPA: ribokinase [Ilumatobacter sp.]